MLRTAANVAQRGAVVGLIAGTGFLIYSSAQQARHLQIRRARYEAKLKELEEQGEVPEGASEGKAKGFKYDRSKLDVESLDRQE